MHNVMKQEYNKYESSNTSIFYTDEYISYEACSCDGDNISFVKENNGCKLIAPIVENNNVIGGDIFSYIPLPYITDSNSDKNKKKLIEYYLDFIITKKKDIYLRQDPLVKYDDLLIKSLLENNFNVLTFYTSIIDLTKNEDFLWSNVRRSYKSLINKAKREFKIETFSDYSENIKFFNDWKNLYNIVTKRANVIVEEKIWDKIENLFYNKRTIFFAIYKNNLLISCVEIAIHNNMAYYLHGATHPDYEAKHPFTHSLLWEAILYLKMNNYYRFEIGPIFFEGLNSYNASAKELSISKFKIGMGGKLMPFFIFNRKISEKN